MLRRHLGPFFGSTEIAKLDAARHRRLHQRQAPRRSCDQDDHQPPELRPRRVRVRDPARLGSQNPVAMTDRPPSPPADPDIRFLDREELEALLRAAVDDVLGPTDRVLWLTAAMTGLRQGELAGLRWRDVDWSARLVRVRRSYSRGQWTTPKSRRSSRAVPMADRVAAELERHFSRSAYTHDDELVFCHPETGAAVRREQEPRAVQAGARAGGAAATSLPRPAPHLRHPNGRGRGAATDTPGLDGPPRLQDDGDLRRLRARSDAGRAVGTARIRRRTDGRSVRA